MSSQITVCVTGASGYIAAVLVSQLLQKGYHVKGTVRSLADQDKVAALQSLANNTPGKLTLVEADLLKEGSFDDAVSGCDYVFHTASPFIISVENPQRDLVDPALLGTRNVLNSVAKFKTQVKRVILTSSVAAVRGIGSVPKNGKIFNEEDWNTVATIETMPYPFSKTVAEKEAWKLAGEHGFDLVTINPSLVVGPPATSRVDGTSIGGIKGLMEGRHRKSNFAVVDVRDIAAAHVLAMEKPDAKGRYIVSSRRGLQPGTCAEIIKNAFPQLPINVEEHKSFDEKDPQDIFDTAKVQTELGLKLTNIEQSLVDMAKSLLDLGIVKAKL